MKLQVGDIIFELEYTVNSVCDLEEVTGKSILEVFAMPEFSSIRSLLWCGLIANIPGLTIIKAGNILQEWLKTRTIQELVASLGEAIDLAGFIVAQEIPTKQVKRVKKI